MTSSRLIITTMILISLGPFNTCGQEAQRSPGDPLNLEKAGDYDLAFLRIQDETLKEFVGGDRIPVRAKSFILPYGDYPLLKLGEIEQKKIRSIMNENIERFSGVKVSREEIRDLGHIFAARIGTRTHWVSKASGAYCFSENDKVMSVPCKIADHREAVRIALRYLKELRLVELGEHESIDIVYVSNVMNAAINDGEKDPFMIYPSDYFVGFGRRYRGIPVIGSRLTLRVGEAGKLLGVQKNWREITGELLDGKAKFGGSSILQMTKERLLKKGVVEKDQDIGEIEIISITCGYFEGYVSNEQNRMGLGCLVNYRSPGSEMIGQLVFPLDDLDFPLLGVRKHFERAEPVLESIKSMRDKDDRKARDENK